MRAWLSSPEKFTVLLLLSGNLYVEVLAEHVGSGLNLVELRQAGFQRVDCVQQGLILIHTEGDGFRARRQT